MMSREHALQDRHHATNTCKPGHSQTRVDPEGPQGGKASRINQSESGDLRAGTELS